MQRRYSHTSGSFQVKTGNQFAAKITITAIPAISKNGVCHWIQRVLSLILSRNIDLSGRSSSPLLSVLIPGRFLGGFSAVGQRHKTVPEVNVLHHDIVVIY